MMALPQNKLWNWLVVVVLALSLLGLLMLTSCEKEEPLWKLPPPGAEETDQVGMGETYETTVFYKFSTKTQIERNLNTWHLQFESAPTGWHIRMNGGRAMQIWNTGSTNFAQVIAADDDSNWDWDISDGNDDSTAIGQWFTDNLTRQSKLEVYVIDMGLAASPKYKKMQILGVSDTAYIIKYANLDNTAEQTLLVRKNTAINSTYLDMVTGKTVAYEPAPQDYDIVFTRYRYIFYEEAGVTPYLVNGALLNPVNTLGLKSDSTNFEKVDYEMIKDRPLTAAEDIIGYDWKYYDFDLSLYTIVPHLFIVKDAGGNLWKLQFYDFYNDAGTKGYPKFKFQRL
ncbi:MAG TPA: HmuY family protein [Chitinophagales bacterium]|nr:HmuY family protein [Chitinophagales bacterium]